MKLANIQVSARLKDSPAAIFKVNQLSVSEDERSVTLSSLNDVHGQNIKQGHFEHCFDQHASCSDVARGMETPKYLKQLLHGYNAAVLSFGVGESEIPGSRVGFILESLDTLQRLLDVNAYRYDYRLAYALFGLSDTHCVNLNTFQKCTPTEIAQLLQDHDGMEEIGSVREVRATVERGYTLPLVVFVALRTAGRNELTGCAANVSLLALGDLGSLNNPAMEKSLSHLRSIALTLDQTFVSGEIRVRETPLTHLLSPFIGGNANTLVLLEFLTNASFQAVTDGLFFSETLRKIKNRIEQNFENHLAVELEEVEELNERLERERRGIERQLKQANGSLSRLLVEREALRREQTMLAADSETRRFLLEYNSTRMEMEQLELKERIRALRIEMVHLEHQKAVKGQSAVEESLARKRAELELGRAIRGVRDADRQYSQQVSSLKDRIGKASEELQRSVEERSIMQSKLQNAQLRSEQLAEQLKDVEAMRHRLERALEEQRTHDSKQSLHVERQKTNFEVEMQNLRRQLELARESERTLSLTASRVESKSEQSRREMVDLERELRMLRNENMLLQAKLEAAGAGSGGNPETGLVLAKMEAQMRSERVAMQSTVAEMKETIRAREGDNQRLRSVIETIKTDGPGGESGKPARVPSTAKRNARETNAGEESPLLDLSRVTTRRASKRKSGANVVSEPSGAVALDETPRASIANSPNKEWKASSFIPGVNLTRRGVAITAEPETENATSFLANLSITTNDAGRKKIRLPDRARPVMATAAEAPRSTPLGKTVDSSVLDSIMSSFTVKLPAKK